MNDLINIFLALIIFAGTIIGVSPEKVVHDGSRTGERVGYQSYCNPEQGVVIYENEKMPFTTDEGEQVLWTQGDIDCYKERKLAEEYTLTPTLLPSQTIKKNYKATPTTDPDPIIDCVSSAPNCNGSSIKAHKSQCPNIICCQVSNNWSVYPTKEKCTEAQNSYRPPTRTYTNNYPLCTVYYPYTNYSYTYPNIEPSLCLSWQQQAKSNSGAITQAPINTPTPTVDNTEYKNLLRQHQEACNKAAAEWVGIREQWEQVNQNNFSGSAEMVMALNQRMIQYQQELYNAGCSNKVSLY